MLKGSKACEQYLLFGQTNVIKDPNKLVDKPESNPQVR